MGCSASRPNILLTKKYSLETTRSSNMASSSPKPFSLQAPLVHHPPSRKGDTHHLVSLTSTTYGSLLLINGQDCPDQSPLSSNTNNKITQMPPPPPTTNPVESLSPDSVINTWELMDGLDDYNDDDHDFNFDNKADACGSVKHSPSITKPLWKHLSEESLLSKMDPNVASSYRRALSSRLLGSNHQPKSPVVSSFTTQIVIYFTSLRGIRKTYEDCCSVRMILKSYRVVVDERDVSMDTTYRKDLQGLLGGEPVTLPQVFVRGKHIGGAEEIKQLNENGELGKLLRGFPVIKNGVSVCESCGDARFVPCPNCCGSRKVFDEEEDQLKRCPHCNENGLIRCPACCCSC